MDAIDDHEATVPLGDVYGHVEVRVQRPRPLVDVLVRSLTYLVRGYREQHRIVSPERKVEHPGEVMDQDFFDGEIERQQAIQVPSEIQEHSPKGARDYVVAEKGIKQKPHPFLPPSLAVSSDGEGKWRTQMEMYAAVA